MITEKTAFQLLQEEFCSRYGLDPKQVEVKVNVWLKNDDALAQQIAEDYKPERGHIQENLYPYKDSNSSTLTFIATSYYNNPLEVTTFSRNRPYEEKE